MKIIILSARCAFTAFAFSLLSACHSDAPKVASAAKPLPVNPAEINLYAGTALSGWHINVADFEAQTELATDLAVVPKIANSKVPNSDVRAMKSTKLAANDALTLKAKETWYASLRVEGGAPIDLHDYLAKGVLAFDVNVVDMAQGGLSFKINCGKNCERQVPFLIPARAMAGKGWQHLAFSMSCFVRDGDDFSAVTQPFAMDSSGTLEVAIANIKFQKVGEANTSCPNYKTVSVTPDMLNESWSVNWWLPRHQQKLEQVKTLVANHQAPEVVFIGDSITHNWEKDGFNIWQKNYTQYHAVDLGFGGDRTENVLWRLQHGAVDGISPKVAVLMFGTNNTGARQEDPNTTALGIKRNLDELQQRLPNTKILLLAIFPRDAKPDGQLRQINERVNNIIAGYADNKRIYFLNINNTFLTADGTLTTEIMPDLLHPNEKGYALWAAAMNPTLKALLAHTK